LPTGTGKSLVIAEFIKRAFQTYPTSRFIKLTHVKELIEQNYKTLIRQWPTAPCGIFSAGLGRKQSNLPITFAGIASVVNCAEEFGHIDMVFIDEAHLVSPKDGTMYQKFLTILRNRNPMLKVVGFTATHYRLGQGLLTEAGGLFTDVCFDLTYLEAFNWLINEGYLCPLIPKRTNAELNLDAVRIQAGEYVQKDLQEAVDREEITFATLKETLAYASDRNHWLVFASGIEHAVHVRDMIESFGIPATVVHSKMSDGERDRNIADFKAGKYRAMVNNGILTTGFDFPEIDLIVMLRPTQSPGLWVQMLGRGTRPVYAEGFDLSTSRGRLGAQQAGPKKNCLVLDFAGNTRRLGPINDPVIPRKKGKKGCGHAPVKTCEVCGVYNHASVRFCTACGAEFHSQIKFGPNASTDELIRQGTPEVSKFKVDRVTYSVHRKEGRPDSIEVSYFTGLRMFKEWVCLEHEGYAKKKSRDWWRQRTSHADNVPQTTFEAMQRITNLRVPTHINVWVNKKHPEIMGYLYEQQSMPV
jgi:DNA repair protein RadD